MTTRPLAIVTGATGGIGRQIVTDLVATHDVVAIGRNGDALAACAAAGARTARLDLGSASSDEAVEQLVTDLDRIDVVVHAAAIAEPASAADSDRGLWERHLQLNVIAPGLLTRYALPKLRAVGGTVVFIGSGAATRGVAGSAVYAATKHALRGLADSLRAEEAARGVRVATVAPGQTHTPMNTALRAALGAEDDPGAYIRPTSVAAAVRFVIDAPPDAHLTDIAVRPRVEL